MRKRKILILDDSPLVREMVDIALSEHGYEVVGLASPFDFAAALRREQPDLVLMDVTMPALAGDKVVEFARRYSTDSCPIILFSDRSESELARLASQCGADGYIGKTWGADALPSRVAKFLRD
jgi:DNA-binding response OmpR family regulator